MSTLAQFLSSQVRAEIFRLLFHGDAVSLHLREIHRQSHLAVGTIQKEMKHLKLMDLVTSQKDGNRLYYAANSGHPLYSTICELVQKTSGIPEKLKSVLVGVEEIECAFIFGSIARGTAQSHSDIDLIVIGDVGLRTLLPKLKLLTEQTQREINPHIYSKSSWKQKLKKNDHFIKSVLKEKKIFLIGDDDVFG